MAGQRGLLESLARLDRTKVFLGTLAVGLAGLFLPVPVGPVLLLAVVVVLAGLLRITWPVTPVPLRAVRLVILAGLATVALVRLVG